MIQYPLFFMHKYTLKEIIAFLMQTHRIHSRFWEAIKGKVHVFSAFIFIHSILMKKRGQKDDKSRFFLKFKSSFSSKPVVSTGLGSYINNVIIIIISSIYKNLYKYLFLLIFLILLFLSSPTKEFAQQTTTHFYDIICDTSVSICI